MLSLAVLLLLLSPHLSYAEPSRGYKTPLRRQARSYTLANGEVDTKLIVGDTLRTTSKYSVSMFNYKHNNVEGSDSQKRQLEVLATARKMEKRQNSKRKMGKRQNGAVPLTDYYTGGRDAMYYGKVTTGTPAQSFQIDFDTGSGDYWLYAPNAVTSHTKFQNSSSTLTTSTAPWSIRYATGASKGYLAQDVVNVGGYTVRKQVFALANVSAPSLEALPVDGLMGMGFSSIASSGQPTFFENLIAQNGVTNHYFSFYLQRAADLTSDQNGNIGGGEMCVGCLDSSKYTGSITYTPVTTKGYWEIPMGGVAANGNVVSGTAVTAAIDTGTTLIYIPVATANTFYKSIGGISYGNAGLYAYPCSTDLKSVGLAFGGVTYLIDLNDLVLGYSPSSTTQCVLGILGVDQLDANGVNVAIIGDLFLKSVYSVFSYSNNGSPAVGFAVSITSGVATTSNKAVEVTEIAAVTQQVPLASVSAYAQPANADGSFGNSTSSNSGQTSTTSAFVPAFTAIVISTAMPTAHAVSVNTPTSTSSTASSTPTSAASQIKARLSLFGCLALLFLVL